MEVDPLIQRALRLLVSRKPDSTEKLKEMLFESLGREYVPPTKEEKAKSRISRSHDSIDSFDDEANDMGADTDCSTDVGGAKNEDTMDTDDFAFDMGISCVICRQFDVSSNNQLVECQECHSLYHQQCHKPPMSDGQDWFCYKCSSPPKSSPEKVKSSSKAENSSRVKKEWGEAFKKPDKKNEKSSGESSKDKKSKSDKKAKEKSADKIKAEPEKEKVKKHKSSDKESKSDGQMRKDKEKSGSKSSESTKSSSAGGSKSSESTKSSSAGGSKSSSKEKGGSERHKSSSAGGDLKHKRTDSHHDKEKKVKKAKREKQE